MSLIFLFQGTAANMDVCEQIEKISDFLSNYQEHKEFDGDSFLEFVVEGYFNSQGYFGGHHHDSKHDNAPVHSSKQCCQHIIFFSPFYPPLISNVPKEEQSQFNYYTLQLYSRYLESLFQPPKV